MTTGLLWFDDSTKSLAEKIRKAADYYQKKYGRRPELCLVNPNMLGSEAAPDIEGIIIRTYRPVLPGHLWIGFEEMPTEKEPA